MVLFLFVYFMRTQKIFIKKQLLKTNKIVKWKVHFIHYQSVLEFLLFNTSITEVSFSATILYLFKIRRIRNIRNSTVIFNLIYLFFAGIYLFELILISMSLKYSIKIQNLAEVVVVKRLSKI